MSKTIPLGKQKMTPVAGASGVVAGHLFPYCRCFLIVLDKTKETKLLIRWRKVKMEAEKNAASSGKKLEAACSSVPECAWATVGNPSNTANTSNVIMLINS